MHVVRLKTLSQNNSQKANSTSAILTVSAMQLPLWRLTVMSQVLRSQLTHMQTHTDPNTTCKGKATATEREAVSDGEGKVGYGSQRGIKYYEYYWHSYWLPRDCYYGEK